MRLPGLLCGFYHIAECDCQNDSSVLLEWLSGCDVVANPFLDGCYGVPTGCQGVVKWL